MCDVSLAIGIGWSVADTTPVGGLWSWDWGSSAGIIYRLTAAVLVE